MTENNDVFEQDALAQEAPPEPPAEAAADPQASKPTTQILEEPPAEDTAADSDGGDFELPPPDEGEAEGPSWLPAEIRGKWNGQTAEIQQHFEKMKSTADRAVTQKLQLVASVLNLQGPEGVAAADYLTSDPRLLQDVMEYAGKRMNEHHAARVSGKRWNPTEAMETEDQGEQYLQTFSKPEGIEEVLGDDRKARRLARYLGVTSEDLEEIAERPAFLKLSIRNKMALEQRREPGDELRPVLDTAQHLHQVTAAQTTLTKFQEQFPEKTRQSWLAAVQREHLKHPEWQSAGIDFGQQLNLALDLVRARVARPGAQEARGTAAANAAKGSLGRGAAAAPKKRTAEDAEWDSMRQSRGW